MTRRQRERLVSYHEGVFLPAPYPSPSRPSPSRPELPHPSRHCSHGLSRRPEIGGEVGDPAPCPLPPPPLRPVAALHRTPPRYRYHSLVRKLRRRVLSHLRPFFVSGFVFDTSLTISIEATNLSYRFTSFSVKAYHSLTDYLHYCTLF